MWHLPNAVSTLAQRLQGWPNIETEMGNYPCLLGLQHCHVGDTIPPPPVARKATTQVTQYIGPMLM